MQNVGTTPAGTTWVCGRCVEPYQYRRASDQVPERHRVRLGVCATCKPVILAMIAERTPAIAAAVQGAGKVRLLFAHRNR